MEHRLTAAKELNALFAERREALHLTPYAAATTASRDHGMSFPGAYRLLNDGLGKNPSVDTTLALAKALDLEIVVRVKT